MIKTPLTPFLLLIALFAGTQTSFAIKFGDIDWKPGIRIGLFPGTYDPPHLSHLAVAESSLREGNLDYLIMIANDLNIHKIHATNALVRDALLFQLAKDNPRIVVLKPGEFPFPKMMSLSAKIKTLEKTAQLFGILGSDVAQSRTRSVPFILASLKFDFQGWIVNTRNEDFNLTEFYDGKPVQVVHPDTKLQLSSTVVRNAFNAGLINAENCLSYGLTLEVYQLIMEMGLYPVTSSGHCVNILVNQ